ncbi:uncharacterized protein LOC117778545 isoform X2 [Hippoglossus hippoglossus]|uniref:uncharacterized protein LOC117778545 isoform X2 n=1 Tax=Hippoglossus hippoglossus TaxID=8267 RepID=UPI00148DE620|nr:uncharacterized protein LOC117778545 isoform X2 [Hippoglossus hippoglossus]
MAGSQRITPSPRCCLIIWVPTMLLLVFFIPAFRHGQDVRHRRHVLDSTEIPAEHIDPAAIDLTPLVNTLINSSQSGSRQLFSLLSVTSYSSLALHKLTLLLYNISSIRRLESDVLRRRFCYCVTNDTNDLTDFTAVLLDVIGNSTTHLHELFKSASILSVSHRNNSGCIYICVMAGRTGPEAPELWDVGSISPLFNQTIVEGPHGGNVSSFRIPVGESVVASRSVVVCRTLKRHFILLSKHLFSADWNQLPTNLSHISPSGMSSVLSSRVHATAHVSPASNHEMAATTAKLAAARQLTSVVQQSQTTADAPETTPVIPTQKTMKPTVNTEQSQATTVLQPTTRSTTTTAASTTQLTTVSSEPVTSSPVISLTRLTSSPHLRTTTQPWTPSAPRYRPTPPRPLSWRTTTPSKQPEKPGCPWRRPEQGGESASSSTTTVGAHKLQPCVLELCKFFSQCLCRPVSHRTRTTSFCDDSHLWYETHTSEVCRRVRRVSFSRNLKQRCLTKMCNKL